MYPFIGFGGAEIIIMLLFYSGVGLPLGIPPAEPDPVLVRIAPEKPLYFAMWNGMAEAKADSANQTEALLAEPEIKELVKQLDAKLSTGFARLATEADDPDAKLAAEMAPLWIKTAITRPTVMFLTKLELKPGGGPPDIAAGMVINAGDQTIALRDAFLKMQTRHLEGKVKEVDIGGAKFYRFKVQEDAPEITWGTRKNYLFFAIGAGTMEAIVEKSRTPAPAWLAEVQKQSGIPRVATVSYGNVSAIIDLITAAAVEESANPKQAKAVISALGLSNLSTFASVTGLDDQGFVSRTVVEFKGKPTGPLAILDSKPLAAADLQPVPKDSTMAGVLRLDGLKVLDMVLDVAKQIDPDQGAEMAEQIDLAGEAIGVNVRDELLAGLGDTWCIYNSAGENGLTHTGFTAAVSIRDHAKIAKVHKQLLAMAEASLRGPDEPDRFARPRPQIKNMEFAGQTIYYVTGGEEMPVAPAWCLTEKQLYVSLLPQNIVALLSRDAKYESIAASPEVAKALADGGPLMLTYVDTKTLFELIYPIVPIGMQAFAMQMNRMEGMRIDFDVALLPPAQVISRHLRPSVTAMARSKTGLVFTTRQSLPGNSAGISAPTAVALLLPAINAAREAARRNGSLNNLRQLGLGVLNYESANARFPAQALKTKDGKPGLSWRVAILPFIEEQHLYRQFKLDEPWDSEHNKKLISQMPLTLRSPKSTADFEAGMTTYQAVVGDNTVIAKGVEGKRIAAIKDGTSKTIMLVETNDDAAVVWTKPEDWEFDEMKPTKGIEGVWSGNVFLGLFADCHVQALSLDIDGKVLKSLFSCNGGEIIRSEDLDPGTTPRTTAPAVEEFEEFREETPEDSREPAPVP